MKKIMHLLAALVCLSAAITDIYETLEVRRTPPGTTTTVSALTYNDLSENPFAFAVEEDGRAKF